MKSKRGLIAVIFLCVSAVAAFSTSEPQKRERILHNVNYKFESEPRAILSPDDSASVRHAKLFMRTSTLYALAVYKTETGNPQLGLAMSKDGGDSFEPPVMISESSASVSSHGENSPTLAIDGISFYALWEQSRQDGGTDLMFARSLRFGRKFDAPIRVTDKTTPSSNAFSYLAVAPSGDIYAVWLDGRDRQAAQPGSHASSHGMMEGTSSLYMSKSTDKGATFGKNIRVSAGVCPCCRPAVAFGQKGEVHIAWRAVYAEDTRDMAMATSTDGGATFSAPVRVAFDNWKINGCPHSGPTMSVRGRRLFIAWYSEGDGANAGIRLSWSDDAGRRFAPPVIASKDALDADHPALSLSEDGRMMLAFQGRDPAEKDGWGIQRVYISEVSEAGAVSKPVAVTGNKKSVSYPAILAGTVGRVFVAWTEGTENGAKVFLSRGRRERLEKAAGSNPD